MGTSCSNKEKLLCSAETDGSDRDKRVNNYFSSPNQKISIMVTWGKRLSEPYGWKVIGSLIMGSMMCGQQRLLKKGTQTNNAFDKLQCLNSLIAGSKANMFLTRKQMF